MRSLRGVLVLETIFASASIVFVSAVLLYFLVESVLVEQFDRSLLDNLLPIAASVEQESGKIELDLENVDLREFQRSDRPAYFQLWLEGSTATYRSPLLGERDLGRIDGDRESPGFAWITLPDGRDGRGIGFSFTPREDGAKKKRRKAEEAGVPWVPSQMRVSLVLARETAPILVPLRRIGAWLGAVGLSAMLITAAFLWWIIRQNLSPLSRLAAQIARLDSGDLAARLNAPDAREEIRPVVERMNEFLQRLEASFQRERTLTANVAHELRTPLAGIRATIEVALSRPRTTDGYRESLTECHRIAADLQTVVDNLLVLARIESGHTRARPRAVQLRDRLLANWRPFEDASVARQLQVDWQLAQEGQVVTDPALLDVVLRNIFDNAVEYADQGGQVRIAMQTRSDGAEVRVQNTGSTLGQDEAQQVFDRFWRGGSARSDAGTHCGLGLVLVKEIMQTLGGGVSVRSCMGGWFEIVLSIPNSGVAALSGGARVEAARRAAS